MSSKKQYLDNNLQQKRALQRKEITDKLLYDQIMRQIAVRSLNNSEMDKIWQERIIENMRPAYKTKIQILRQTFERINDKLKYKMNRLKETIIAADRESARINYAFGNKVNNITGKYYDQMETLAESNRRKTAQMMKNLKIKQL